MPKLKLGPKMKEVPLTRRCECEGRAHENACGEKAIVRLATDYGPFNVCSLCWLAEHMPYSSAQELS